MTQLAANVNADAERWTLDSLPSTQYVQVDDETIEVRAMFPSQTYTLTGEELPPRIRVRRAVGGTTAASHNSGSTLTPTYGLGGGGGGGAIAVTGGGVTVNDVTELDLGAVPVSDVGGGVASVEQVFLSRTTTLTDAQIKALPITAVELVPAPGAGAMLVPTQAILRMTWVADYTNIDVAAKLGVTQLGAGEAGAGAGSPVFLGVIDEVDVGVGSLLGLGADAFAFAGPRLISGAASDFTRSPSGYSTFDVENVALFLRASNGAPSLAFTGGNAGNSLKVTVIYTVIEI